MSLERIFCRTVAAWLSFCACQLVRERDFFQIRYAQAFPILKLGGIVLLFFLLYSVFNLISLPHESDSWLLMLSSTACAVCWLRFFDDAQNKFLFALAVFVPYTLITVYFVQKNELLFRKRDVRKCVWPFALLCGVACGTLIAAVTCYRYLTFSSPNFDFGLFVNMFWQMKKTGLPFVTCERDVLISHFAVHISPIYYLLLPFFALFPSPLTLQIGQAAVVASGVIPTVLLCKHYRLSGKSTCLMAFVYAFHPALSAGCFFDIHENCFLAPLLLWTFYFVERRKYVPMYLFAFLCMSVKEDAAFYIFILALYLILSGKNTAHGFILMICSASYFGIAMSVLRSKSEYFSALYQDQSPNPAIQGPMIHRFSNLIHEEKDGLLGALKTLLLNPGYILTQLFKSAQNGGEKLVYFLQILLPVGGLPFCTEKPSRLLLVSPILINLLTDYSYQYNIGFQYHFGIVAFLLYASIVNLSDMRAKLRHSLLSVAVCACLCLYVVYAVAPFSYYQKLWRSERDTYTKMEEILKQIPEDASVSCSSGLVAHIANRDEIYEVYYHGTVADTDYVVLDIRGGIDRQQLRSFLRQGYSVNREFTELILILYQPDN